MRVSARAASWKPLEGLHGGLLLTQQLSCPTQPHSAGAQTKLAGSTLNPSTSLLVAPPPSVDFLAERNKLLYNGELFQGKSNVMNTHTLLSSLCPKGFFKVPLSTLGSSLPH